jgi:hypothetical protein
MSLPGGARGVLRNRQGRDPRDLQVDRQAGAGRCAPPTPNPNPKPESEPEPELSAKACPFSTGGGTRRVRLVWEEGRDVSSQYGREGEWWFPARPPRPGGPRSPGPRANARRAPPPPRGGAGRGGAGRPRADALPLRAAARGARGQLGDGAPAGLRAEAEEVGGALCARFAVRCSARAANALSCE